MSLSYSGWLDKRGGQDASKGWKRRWCILKDSSIRYYKTDTATVPAGTIFGEDIEKIIEDDSDSQKDTKMEWIIRLNTMIDLHRSEVPTCSSICYATAEIYLNKGVRINGEVGDLLSSKLTTPNSKTTTDDRGWFIDTPHSHTSVLNLFTQHGWSLVTAFQCNLPLPGTNNILPSDTLVFSHPHP